MMRVPQHETRAAPLPPLDRIPPGIVALADYAPFARARLDDMAWAYLTGGAADGLTMRWNREAYEAWRLCGRVLAPCEGGNTRTDLLGTTLAHPILLAPVAYQKLFHPDGETATALAAAAMETIAVVSTLSSVALEDVARAGEGSPQWFQLYIQPDRGFTGSLIERAEAAGYRALVITVDAPVSGVRNREQRAGFRLPPGVEAANLRGMAQGPAPGPGAHPVFDVALAGAPSWADIDAVVARTRLPVLVKGILSPRDACEAVDRGAVGVIVSNHGGRTLDTLMASLDALPRVVEAVGDSVPVLLDGGIRRGTDVLKALALGARAVLIGQPYALALAAAGALGVAHALRLLVEEFAVAMTLTGCREPRQIGRDLLVHAPPGGSAGP
jgi:4-hydroxymandelate oxidase